MLISRIYVKMERNRGKLKFNPNKNEPIGRTMVPIVTRISKHTHTHIYRHKKKYHSDL
jgi:hypothetical protein